MPSLRALRMFHFKLVGDGQLTAGGTFCQIFSTLFPGLRELYMIDEKSFVDEEEGESLEAIEIAISDESAEDDEESDDDENGNRVPVELTDFKSCLSLFGNLQNYKFS